MGMNRGKKKEKNELTHQKHLQLKSKTHKCPVL